LIITNISHQKKNSSTRKEMSAVYYISPNEEKVVLSPTSRTTKPFFKIPSERFGIF